MKDIEHRRQAEWKRYRRFYASEDYGARTSRHDATEVWLRDWLRPRAFTTWLDVGAGAADHSPIAAAHGIELSRTDPGIDEGDDTPAHLLLDCYGPESFDLVTSFDCLEHLLPDELDTGLRQLWDVARGAVAVSVGAFRSGWKGHHDLHHTVLGASEWFDRIAAAWPGAPSLEFPCGPHTPFYWAAKP